MTNEQKNEKKHPNHQIFVNDIHEDWDQDLALASEIMTKAGITDPSGFILEALDKRNGKAVAEFKPNETVDLTQKDRKFFRTTPGGGGFS